MPDNRKFHKIIGFFRVKIANCKRGTSMKIVLIGYMGSGKSIIGKNLAAELKIPFIDIDAEIEKHENSSISKIFSNHGEIYFRNLENKILKMILSGSGSFVLATGGGTPCYGNNMAIMSTMEDVQTVYLKTPLDLLVSRLLADDQKRPLLAHLDSEPDLSDFIRKHLFERVFYYSQANFTIENNTEDPKAVLTEIMQKLF